MEVDLNLEFRNCMGIDQITTIFTDEYESYKHGFNLALELFAPVIIKQDEALEFYNDERNWDGIEINTTDIAISDDASIDGYQHSGKLARTTQANEQVKAVVEYVRGKK